MLEQPKQSSHWGFLKEWLGQLRWEGTMFAWHGNP